MNKIITHINFLGKKNNVARPNSKLEIWHGLNINLTHINSQCDEN